MLVTPGVPFLVTQHQRMLGKLISRGLKKTNQLTYFSERATMPYKHKQMTSTTTKQVLKAFRHAVETQIKDWKEQHPWTRGAKCPITGEVMTKGQSEVDHCDSSFRELVDDFLSDSAHGLTLEDLKDDVRFLHSQKRWYFQDSAFEARWAAFHRRNAKLRYVSRTGNRKAGDHGYRKRKRETPLGRNAKQVPRKYVNEEWTDESEEEEKRRKKHLDDDELEHYRRTFAPKAEPERTLWLRLFDSMYEEGASAEEIKGKIYKTFAGTCSTEEEIEEESQALERIISLLLLKPTMEREEWRTRFRQIMNE